MYDYGCNTESYGPIRIATNDAGLYPWLIRRPVRECVTWAYAISSNVIESYIRGPVLLNFYRCEKVIE